MGLTPLILLGKSGLKLLVEKMNLVKNVEEKKNTLWKKFLSKIVL
jgi:hypothetical protein